MATGGGTGTVLGKRFPCETNDLSRATRTRRGRGYGQRIFGRSAVSGQKLRRITWRNFLILRTSRNLDSA